MTLRLHHFEEQPNFPLEDASAVNTERMMEVYRLEQAIQPADSASSSHKTGSLQMAVSLRAILGDSWVPREAEVDIASLERGTAVMEYMAARLSSRKRRGSSLVMPGLDPAVLAISQGQLNTARADMFIKNFTDTMPNTAGVIEVAAHNFDARSALLGALTSRSLAISTGDVAL